MDKIRNANEIIAMLKDYIELNKFLGKVKLQNNIDIINNLITDNAAYINTIGKDL